MAGRIRFGVAGTNRITTKFLAGARLDPRFALTAVCSRSMERAEAFAAEYGAAHAFASIGDMARCAEVDAVYIAVPNSLHAHYATACMERGKHVLCEKPAASNAAEWLRMTEAARENGVTLMEAMLPTTSPNFKVIRDALRSLGAARRYFSAYCQQSSRYDELMAGKTANVFNPAMSGGATTDIGVYTIYPMVALFGMPESISARGVRLPSGVDGQATVTMDYPGMEAVVAYSKTYDSYLPSEIVAEDGNLVMSRMNVLHDVTLVPRRRAESGWGPEAERKPIGVTVGKSDFYYETREFIDTVVGGSAESLLNNWESSLATLRITDEIRRQLGVVFPADKG